MSKRTISAKEAVADIRAGMSNAVLMTKYNLSPDALRSLMDKLVSTGYLDLSETVGRMPDFLGLVSVAEPLVRRDEGRGLAGHKKGQTRSSAWITAHEAARDVRSGMDDSTLMQKYRLSPMGIQSLFAKLMTVGLLTQEDLDRRRLGTDDTTVDLKEDQLSLSAVLAQMAPARPKSSSGRTVSSGSKPFRSPSPVENDRKEPAVDSRRIESTSRTSGGTTTYEDVTPSSTRQSTPSSSEAGGSRQEQGVLRNGGSREGSLLKKGLPQKTNSDSEPEPAAEPEPPESKWYNGPLIVLLLLMSLFPLGFYGLYIAATLSATSKILIASAWAVLAAVALFLFLSKR